MDLRIREACAADAETLFRWRNDPVTRAESLNTAPVPWPDHVEWLARALADPNRVLLIGEQNHAPVGTIRFDGDGDSSDASWTIAPEARGKGMGAKLLSAALAFARTPDVIAYIKVGNMASKRIAKKAGFAFASVSGDVERWELRRERA